MYQIAPIDPRIQKIKDKRRFHDSGNMILCGERTEIYTKYYKSHEAELPALKRAGALYSWCENHEVRLEEDEIFVANLCREWRGAQAYLDWSTEWLEFILELPGDEFTREWQSKGSYAYISPEDREIFKEGVEYWRGRSIHASVYSVLPEKIWELKGDNCTTFGNRTKLQTAFLPQGHFTANYKKVIDKGWDCIIKEAQSRLDEIEGKVFEKNAKRNVTWRSIKLVAEGAKLLTERYAALVFEEAKKAEGTRRAELEKMADSLVWIAGNPARTFWESLQIILIYTLLLHIDAQAHGITLGRLDQYCGHFLEQELAEGSVTVEEAQKVTDAFILKLGDYIGMQYATIAHRLKRNPVGIPTYSYQCGGHHFTVGGITPDGRDATNTLTLLFLQTYARLYLTIPSLSVRIHKNTPESVWEHAIESSKIAGGMPTFENDGIIIPALVERGMSQEDANNYCIVGCVEPSGSGNEWSACGSSGAESFCNLVGIMNMAIHNGKNPMTGCDVGLKTGHLYDYETFGAFKEAFLRQLAFFLDWHISYVNFYELAYSQFFPCVSATATIEGCMESGLDVLDGGAKYNSTGFTALGAGNVADSMMTIKKLIFDEKRITARELYDALANNWKGYEDLQRAIIHEVPHYGNSIDEVDELAEFALGAYADHMNNARGPRGKWRGGTFTVVTHVEFGDMTVATPDGRADGTPLAEAISPRQGFDSNGPTAYMLSAAKLPHYKLGNGDQLNIRFSPTALRGEAGTKKLGNLIGTYFDQGGMQVQFNVVATDTLHEAQAHPEDYENLIVRIAGFSVYFVEMPKPLQDDFITRTEHFA
jgi:formate C-acetyltransferase